MSRHDNDGPSDAEFRQFVGPNAEYYLRARNGELSWKINWGGLLFGGLWLLFRKMYVPAAITVCVTAGLLVLVAPGAVAGNAPAPAARAHERSVMLAVTVIVGLAGNRLYLRHAASQIARIRRVSNNAVEKDEMLARAGGTSVAAVGVGLAVVLALAAALALAAT